MAETSGFFDAVYDAETEDYDLRYLAEEFASYFSLFIGNGVFISPTNQLKVHAGEGLTVTVEPGWAFIDGYWYHNDEQRTLVVPPNATSQIRTDCVKCRLDYANRRIQSMYFNGTTEVDRGGNYYDLKLAEVIVQVSSVQILESDITDTRMNEEVCGFVKSLMETVPTEDLFSQYDTMFDIWFSKIKGSLGEDPATNLQQQIGFLEDLQTEVKTDIVSAMNWLLDNMSVTTDSTLLIEGMPADAKAVGDQLKNIEAKIPTFTLSGTTLIITTK